MAKVSIEYGVSVPMRDGVILRADVYRPAGEGTVPRYSRADTLR
jgi:predicted acyl esterase